MKRTKLFPFLFIPVIVSGICGGILRAQQLTTAFDEKLGIYIAGALPTKGLIAVSIVAVLLALISALFFKSENASSSERKNILTAIPVYVGAFALLCFAALLLFSLIGKFDFIALVLALFSIYCAIAFISMGIYRFAERYDSSAYNIFAAVPAFWACFLLITAFRAKISDPIIANYILTVFAYIAILLFAYSTAAHLLGKGKKYVAIFSCFIGLYFCITEILSTFIVSAPVTLDRIIELMPMLAFILIMPSATIMILDSKK